MILETRIGKMKKELGRKLSDKREQHSKSSKGGGYDKKKGGDDRKKKFERNKDEKEEHPSKWPAPKDGKPKTRKWRNNDYRYCHKSTGGKCNGKWVMHSAAECEGNKFQFERKRKSNGGDNKRQLQVKKALSTRITQSNSDDSSVHG